MAKEQPNIKETDLDKKKNIGIPTKPFQTQKNSGKASPPVTEDGELNSTFTDVEADENNTFELKLRNQKTPTTNSANSCEPVELPNRPGIAGPGKRASNLACPRPSP